MKVLVSKATENQINKITFKRTRSLSMPPVSNMTTMSAHAQ